MINSKILKILCLFVALFFCKSMYAQPAWSIDILGKEKKPEKYEEKLLASEKTGSKKFGLGRRFLQNTVSHYNFFFNANEGLNSILERAKLAHKDDYSKLLSFYPYTLDNTASQKTELDSVIYRCTAGVLLHDLRTEWVDNFYLLMGKAYFLRKDFDSAGLTFQFINYNLFPRNKKNADDVKVVGSNENQTGVGSVSIANKENNKFLNKVFTRPPSRNEALIWLTRNFIEQNELGDAAGLISILGSDVNLPNRLQNDLQEITAYWFYNQNLYDSAAVHLEKALSNADNKTDKSRWEFLLAQLYETTQNFDKATKYYENVSKHTNNLEMDIFARLNNAKMLRANANPKDLDNSISKLLQMARSDKYDAYRDILFYSAAQLYLQKPDTTKAFDMLKKSIINNTNATAYREKAFLQLGDLAYATNDYVNAKNYYDSIGTKIEALSIDSTAFEDRKSILARLVPKVLIVANEDSLQYLAALPQVEREKIVKALAKKYRKENGLKEEEFEGNNPIVFANGKNPLPDLFATGNASGAWYFYNASARGKGFNDFKQKWGKRTNSDNWRRKSALVLNTPKNAVQDPNFNLDPNAPALNVDDKPNDKQADFSYEGLMGNIPLTKEKLDSSNILVAKNLYEIGQIFQAELQDYPQAITTYLKYVERYANGANIADVYAGLAFCYDKIGDNNKANFYKNILKTKYASSTANQNINSPKAKVTDGKNPAATAQYENIYNLFIEGKFAEAIQLKQQADSSFGKTYWSPQLLYIESVYYIREKKDSLAIAALNNIITLYPTSTLKPKAITMIDVLSRRAAIEKYLTELEVTRVEEEKLIVANTVTAPKTVAPTVKPTTTAPTLVKPTVPKRVISDSIKVPEVFVSKSFVLNPNATHQVAMILDNVDGVFVGEAKNAFARFNRQNSAYTNITITKDAIDASKVLLLFSSFENAEAAIKYYDVLRKVAPQEVSWLQASKYSFIIISESNLQILKTNKDLPTYKQLLKTNFANKF
jgi:tetratricopeptide (TPR) repeat protein